MKKRHVFCVSDGTGITANTLGHSLLSQFENIKFIQTSFPYTDSELKAKKVVAAIRAAYEMDKAQPIVFSTIVKPEIATLIDSSGALVLDFMQSFVGPLEKTLGEKSSHTIGRTHGMSDYESYKRRIDALNFSLNTDDGGCPHQYGHADIILTGVSRCGKTPTSLYLSLQFGLFVANYPITDHELEKPILPAILLPYREKLFGLTIDVDRLIAIRQERRPNSDYASSTQCKAEVKMVENMFRLEGVPYFNSTRLSVEELSTRIKLAVDRRVSNGSNSK